jgi:hypothetical protein
MFINTTHKHQLASNFSKLGNNGSVEFRHVAQHYFAIIHINNALNIDFTK